MKTERLTAGLKCPPVMGPPHWMAKKSESIIAVGAPVKQIVEVKRSVPNAS